MALSASHPGVVQASLPALASLPSRLPPRTQAVIGGPGAEPYARVLRGHAFRIGMEAFARRPPSSTSSAR